MRKLLLVLLLVFLFNQLSLNGQVKKGAIFLGGNVGFYSDKSELNPSNTYERTLLRISPVFGIAVKENLVAGINFSFTSDKITQTAGPSENVQKLNGGGVFIRKYNRLRKSDFSLFFEGQVVVESSNDFSAKNTPTQVEHRHFATHLNFYPGISYRLSRSFQLECGLASLISLGYSNNKTLTGLVNPVTTTSRTFGFSSSLGGLTNINLGLRFLLNN